MAHTFCSIYYHLVWSTKNRTPFINSNMKHRLYSYMRSHAEAIDCPIITMNGMPNHIHILMNMRSKKPYSDIIRDIKTGSSRFVREEFRSESNFAWQEGYGLFSVGLSTKDQVIGYIQKQEEHHIKMSFEEEYVGFLERHQIKYDQRFIFG